MNCVIPGSSLSFFASLASLWKICLDQSLFSVQDLSALLPDHPRKTFCLCSEDRRTTMNVRLLVTSGMTMSCPSLEANDGRAIPIFFESEDCYQLFLQELAYGIPEQPKSRFYNLNLLC